MVFKYVQCAEAYSEIQVEEEKREEHFCRCPFCSCVFVTKADLERHLRAFGNVKEQHLEEYQHCHSRAEFSSEESYEEFF